MDCDQVFAALTRGPFPTGAPDDELVEDHLEACGECWRIAEALRPAENIFQEAISAEVNRDLPGYWGDARPSRVVVARLANTAAQVARERVTHSACPNHVSPPLPISEQRRMTGAFTAMALGAAFTTAIIGFVLWLRG
jgi:hypothetical protein